jgi:IS5 family transposase
MIRQARLFDEESLRALLDRGVRQALENDATTGRRMRVDTTVVESNIAQPTDSGCADAVRVLSRAARRLQALGVGIKGGFARTLPRGEQVVRQTRARVL